MELPHGGMLRSRPGPLPSCAASPFARMPPSTPGAPGFRPREQRAQLRHRRQRGAAAARGCSQARRLAGTRVNTKSLVQQINWEEKG